MSISFIKSINHQTNSVNICWTVANYHYICKRAFTISKPDEWNVFLFLTQNLQITTTNFITIFTFDSMGFYDNIIPIHTSLCLLSSHSKTQCKRFQVNQILSPFYDNIIPINTSLCLLSSHRKTQCIKFQVKQI